MLERVSNMGMGVYVLWGIGLLGLFLKMISNAYLKCLLRESENMATTKKRDLRYMRQAYENGKNLGIRTGNSDSFAEKQVRKMRLLGKPFAFWRRIGELCTCGLVGAMAMAFLYYDPGWRGSPEMVTFLVNGVIVGACLLALENIFLTNNKVERLKANIRDYLENLTPLRMCETRESAATAMNRARTEKMQNNTLPAQEQKEEKEASGEELDRFLREFFGPCEAKSGVKL